MAPGRHAPAGAFALLSEARAAGLTAQMELAGRSLKGQLGFANTLGARYVAILGDGDEAALKDMSGGGQRTLAAEQSCTRSCAVCTRSEASRAGVPPVVACRSHDAIRSGFPSTLKCLARSRRRRDIHGEESVPRFFRSTLAPQLPI